MVATLAALMLAFPHTVDWPDRRPIGSLFLASSAHTSSVNPRGWFNDSSLDIQGDNGRVAFAAALLAYADTSINNLKAAQAQGVIVWDLEGAEYPHKISYIGDPRVVETLAPEMSGVVDEFFARFRRAGLRVGITIRPQQFVRNSQGARQVAVSDALTLLDSKIDYARKRWGATLFYLDSNSGPLSILEGLYLQQLTQRHPGILLIPEHYQPFYWAFSAPYQSFQKAWIAGTPPVIRLVFPRAFSVVNVADASEEQILRAADRQDILLFRAWLKDSETRIVTRISYQRYRTTATSGL